MSRTFAVALLAIGFFAAGWSIAIAAPLELYGRLPSLDNVAISPDGLRLAWVATKGDERYLIAKTIGEKKMLAILRIGDVKLRSVQWLDDRRLLLTTSMTALAGGLIGPRHEWFMMQSYDVEDKELRSLDMTVLDTRTMNTVWGSPMIRHVDGKTKLFVEGAYVTDRTLPALFQVDVASGNTRLMQKGQQGTRGWLVDDAGTVVAEQDYRDEAEAWSLEIRRDNRLAEVASGREAIEHPQILGLGPDGTTALVELMENGDPVWKLLSLTDGSWGDRMADGRNFSDTIQDPATGRLIGGVYFTDGPHYVFFVPQLQARWDAILRAFKDERVELISRSTDFRKIVVRVDGQQHGYSYQLVDFDTKHADLIGEVYDGLDDPGETRPIQYAAADGKAIPAYVTLPGKVPARNLPLIVLPHGGPAVRDTGGFDWWAQALAAQGYAVLQPNYRGSDLNWRFLSSGFGEWGHKMQTDLSDGVRHLAAEGLIDPKRVCIVGGSYGGYAALAGVTLDPGVYRCAVSVAGISDMPRFLRWVDRQKGHDDSDTQRYWDRFMGVTDRHDPALDVLSPITHIGAVTVPVLLIHGKDDTVVPYEQSDIMADALEAAGKSVELVTLEDEDHWLSRNATRQQMLQATVAFLKKHNPPD